MLDSGTLDLVSPLPGIRSRTPRWRLEERDALWTNAAGRVSYYVEPGAPLTCRVRHPSSLPAEQDVTAERGARRVTREIRLVADLPPASLSLTLDVDGHGDGPREATATAREPRRVAYELWASADGTPVSRARFGVVTVEDGRARIDQLPAGRFELRVRPGVEPHGFGGWHREQREPIDIPTTGTLHRTVIARRGGRIELELGPSPAPAPGANGPRLHAPILSVFVTQEGPRAAGFRDEPADTAARRALLIRERDGVVESGHEMTWRPGRVAIEPPRAPGRYQIELRTDTGFHFVESRRGRAGGDHGPALRVRSLEPRHETMISPLLTLAALLAISRT